MTYSIHVAELADARAIAICMKDAFAKDPIMAHLNPNVPRELQLDKDEKLFERWMRYGPEYGAHMIKVVDDKTGNLVGFARWIYAHKMTPELLARKVENEDKRGPPLEGANLELTEEFVAGIQAGRKKWIDPETTFFMHILAIDPAHQRKGLGARLLQPGLEAADKAGCKSFIEATPFGLGLYMKHGWKPVDRIDIDMTPHGGSGIATNVSLMREPQPLS